MFPWRHHKLSILRLSYVMAHGLFAISPKAHGQASERLKSPNPRKSFFAFLMLRLSGLAAQQLQEAHWSHLPLYSTNFKVGPQIRFYMTTQGARLNKFQGWSSNKGLCDDSGCQTQQILRWVVK